MISKTKNIIKLTATTALVTGAMFAAPIHKANASSYQVFTSLSQFIATDWDFIENFKLVLGGTYLNPKSTFKGVQNAGAMSGVYGKSTSDVNDVFPYGQIGYRVHPKAVIGFTVANPVYGHLNFKNGPIAGTLTEFNAKSFTPQVSYQLNDKLTFGLGVDIWHSPKANVDFIPPLAGTGQLTNHQHGAAAGWNASLLWKAVKGTYLTFDYHSKITGKSHGYSTFPGRNMTYGNMNGPLPDTFTLNWLQFLSEKWLINLQGKYFLWKNVFQTFNIRNSALGSLTFPVHYKNSWLGAFYTRYQFAEKWAAFAFASYDSNAQPTQYRPYNLPASAVWFFGLGLDYSVCKNVDVQAFYGIAFANPKFNGPPVTNPRTGRTFNLTTGKQDITVNVVDLRLTYKF